MNKRRRICLFAACLALVIVFFAFQVPSEPEYQGKKLSQWLIQLEEPLPPAYTWLTGSLCRSERQENAAEAIRKMGQATVPFLTRMLRNEGYRPRNFLMETLAKQDFIRPKFNPPSINSRWQALLAVEALGAPAISTLPILAELLETKDYAVGASRALATLGEPGFQILSNAVFHTNYQIKTTAIRSLGWSACSNEHAIELLLKQITDSAGRKSSIAIWALGRIRKSGELVIPTLIASVDEKNVDVCYHVFEALGEYGAEAKDAVPILIKGTQHRHIAVREAATNALLRINPESLETPGSTTVF